MYLKRRDLLVGALVVGTAAGVMTAKPTEASEPVPDRRDKRRSQYQPNSAEVQTFYRVNKYPVK